MIQYSWIIPQDAFQVLPSQGDMANVVKFIKWIRRAEEVDGDVTYTAENSSTFICPEPNPEDYTPYDQLTFEQVCAWFESGMNMETIDSALAKDIQQQNAPKTEILPNPFGQSIE
jgi:hypothetical protein